MLTRLYEDLRLFREAIHGVTTADAALAAWDGLNGTIRAGWADTLSALYTGVALDFAEATHTQLVPQPVKARKDASASAGTIGGRNDDIPPGVRDVWRSAVTDYLLTVGGKKITNITHTTRAWIQQYLANGIEQGLGIDKLAELISTTPGLDAAGIPNRAELIARTETIGASNLGSRTAAKATGLNLKKSWLSTPDSRTRETHRHMDGQETGMDEPFTFPDGSHAMFPGDSSMGALAADIIQCRCTETYVSVAKPAALPATQPTPAGTLGHFTSIDEAEAYVKREWPNIQPDFAGIHIDILNDMVSEFTRLAKLYPEVAKRLEYIGTFTHPERLPAGNYGAIDENAYGLAFSTGKVLALSPKWFSDVERYMKQHEYEVQVGWLVDTPRDAWTSYTVTHEFGHLVHFWLLSSHAESLIDVIRMDGRGTVGDLVEKWTPQNRATDKVSRYAATDKTRNGRNIESWAEGFTALQRAPKGKAAKTAYAKRLKALLDSDIANPATWQHMNDLPYWRDATDEQRQAAIDYLEKLAESIGLRYGYFQ